MTDIFDEVDDDLRRDRMAAFWKRWGGLVLAAAIIVVLATAALTFWKRSQAAQRAEATAALAQAVSAGATDPKATADQLAAYAAKADVSHARLAVLEEAAARAQAGDPVGSAALYDRVAEDRNADQLAREAAALRAATLRFDQLPPADVIKALQPLAAPNAPFSPLARELIALATAKQGDRAQAAKLFDELAQDQATPAGVAQRAREMAQRYRGEN
ncbi:MAG: hypothetical protein JWM77_2902 [Rhodospirillales bacterium]|nr:hypothetical protein [Rhodospirillales bacterium]